VKAAFPLMNEDTSDPGWPYCLPVTMEMIDDLEECSEFVRENILDELARSEFNLVALLSSLPDCSSTKCIIFFSQKFQL
jgi:hypothetical protein